MWMWMWCQRRPKQESKAFSSKGEGTRISLKYERNEEGRHCQIDQRWGFRVRDSQGCCHGFSNDSKYAYFPRFPFFILTFCTSIHFLRHTISFSSILVYVWWIWWNFGIMGVLFFIFFPCLGLCFTAFVFMYRKFCWIAA